MLGKNSRPFFVALVFILCSTCWLAYGRDKLDKIIGSDIAKDLETTSLPTTTEAMEVTTENTTDNATELEDLFAAEEKSVLKDNPDPILEEGDAYGVAWMDIGAPGYDNESISFTGEVRVIQRSPNDEEMEVYAWFKGLEPGGMYEIYLAEWGDLVFNDSCWGAGSPYYFGNESQNYLTYNFTVADDSEEIKFNFTSTLCPLWGDYSIIGRMMVLNQYFNLTDLEILNTTLRYAPDTSPAPEFGFVNLDTTLAADPYENVTTTTGYEDFTTERSHSGTKAVMVGCGPVGIGSKSFSVLYLENMGTTWLPSVAVIIMTLVTSLLGYNYLLLF